jgi:hypothetical protein
VWSFNLSTTFTGHLWAWQFETTSILLTACHSLFPMFFNCTKEWLTSFLKWRYSFFSHTVITERKNKHELVRFLWILGWQNRALPHATLFTDNTRVNHNVWSQLVGCWLVLELKRACETWHYSMCFGDIDLNTANHNSLCSLISVPTTAPKLETITQYSTTHHITICQHSQLRVIWLTHSLKVKFVGFTLGQ